MATATVPGIRIAGMASAVPASTASLEDSASVFGHEAAQKISDSTGVKTRHVASHEICTSDLCEAAARQLLSDLDWSPESIDLLVFVSQTPDYRLPATACVLQGKLGLARTCAAFDLNLGCSGYVYGLWLIAQLMTSGTFQRAFLLVGDTITRTVSPVDRSAASLFGDAGTATALEVDSHAPPMFYDMGTDGTHSHDLMIRAGGFRQPSSCETAIRAERENGNSRSDDDLYMNGNEIFTFTLREVPRMLKAVMDLQAWDIDTTDAFVLHQANQFILSHLAKRMRIPPSKLPISIDDFGNTSSASIPITITERLRNRLQNESMKLVLAGFGVGLSWAAGALSCGPMVISDLVKVLATGKHIGSPDD